LKYITNTLIGSPLSTKSVVNWAYYKEQRSIALGINPFCLEMDSGLFNEIRKNTNAIKQTHYKSNSLSRRLLLLQAINMYVFAIHL